MHAIKHLVPNHYRGGDYMYHIRMWVCIIHSLLYLFEGFEGESFANDYDVGESILRMLSSGYST